MRKHFKTAFLECFCLEWPIHISGEERAIDFKFATMVYLYTMRKPVKLIFLTKLMPDFRVHGHIY